MAVFTYTFRDKTGVLRKDVVDAPSRTELFKKLAEKGIVPVGISEGGSLAKNTTVWPRANKKVVLAIATGILVLTALVTALCLMRMDKTEPGKSHQALQKASPVDITPTTKSSPRKDPSPAATVSVQPQVLAPVKDIHPTNAVEVLSVRTNATGTIVERYRDENGKIVRRVKPAPSIFKHPSDGVLALIAGTKPGQELPPMPANPVTDQEFLDSLNDPIEICTEDSDQVKVLKTNVMALRDEVKKLIDEGMNINDILAEHQKLQGENSQIRFKAVTEMKRLLDEGDRKEAIHYANVMNAAFQQMGVEAIPVPTEKPEPDPRRIYGENK